MNLLRLFRFSVLLAGAFLAVACNQDSDEARTADLEGIWGIDNDAPRGASQEPMMRQLGIFKTHMEYIGAERGYSATGEWRDGGFWCDAKDGSGEIEAAKVISVDKLELHLAAFLAGSKDVLTLYKLRGSDAEIKAVADKYPKPLTYPPPATVVVPWMTEYELTTLPWKPDKVAPPEDALEHDMLLQIHHSAGGRDGTMVYHYHSDDPKLPAMDVTVRDHIVIRVSGGGS